MDCCFTLFGLNISGLTVRYRSVTPVGCHRRTPRAHFAHLRFFAYARHRCRYLRFSCIPHLTTPPTGARHAHAPCLPACCYAAYTLGGCGLLYRLFCLPATLPRLSPATRRFSRVTLPYLPTPPAYRVPGVRMPVCAGTAPPLAVIPVATCLFRTTRFATFCTLPAYPSAGSNVHLPCTWFASTGLTYLATFGRFAVRSVTGR